MKKEIKKGDRVVLNENADIRIGGESLKGVVGTVVRSFDLLGVYAVDFNGEVVKVMDRMIDLVEPEAKQEKKKDEVTITRERFRELSLKAIDPKVLDEKTGGKMPADQLIFISLACMPSMVELEKMIFGESEK